VFLPVCCLGDWEPSYTVCGCVIVDLMTAGSMTIERKPTSFSSLDDITVPESSQPSHDLDIDDQGEFHNLLGRRKRTYLLTFGPGFQ
jgi:hypothetical protein